MKIRIFAMLMMLVLVPVGVHAGDDGLISKRSPHSVGETLDRLQAALEAKGITIVTRWSHDAGAKRVDLELRPTELLIFGNPALGTHFFTSNQTAGIDLPMKALAWEDADGQVWLTYNDPGYIAARHGIDDRDAIVAKMRGALDAMTNKAIATD